MGFAQRIVWAVPALGNLAATYRGWQYNRQRYGRVYEETVAGILERDTWSAERILEYQAEQLRQLVRHAAVHVPHYREIFRERGLTPDDIKAVADLPKLPILEKQELRRDRLRFVDQRLDVDSLLATRTSGTTGVPVRLFMTRESMQMNYAYFEARCRRVAGMEFGKRPYAMFGPRTVAPADRDKPPFWCYNYAWKQLYMSVFHLSDRLLPAYVKELHRRPYHAIMGFPSSLYLLARCTLEQDVSPLSFEVAITSGELLIPEQREVIERAFGCRVFDQYGCSENCVFVAQCPEGSMHISPDFGVLEIVDDDGNQLPPGETGEIVCTGLLNYGQVLIRYRVGDCGAIAPEPCACGRPLPVLQSLDGRSGDTFILSDGRRFTRIGSLLGDVHTVAEWQIVQDDIDLFRVRVVTDPGFSYADVEAIKRNLSSDLGDVTITVEQVEATERTASGKVNLIVCRVPPERIQAVMRGAGAEKHPARHAT